MSEKIEIKCPRCGHKWKMALSQLEKEVTVWRGAKEEAQGNVVKYRAVCPVDGTHVILEVRED